MFHQFKHLSRHCASGSRRLQSTAATNSIHKFKSAVEQFRVQNYSQELPSRCKKEIIKAVDKQGNGVIGIEAFNKMLENIGASSSISRGDVDNIINEYGDGSKLTISTEKVYKIM